jgi:hypothetical protein
MLPFSLPLPIGALAARVRAVASVTPRGDTPGTADETDRINTSNGDAHGVAAPRPFLPTAHGVREPAIGPRLGHSVRPHGDGLSINRLPEGSPGAINHSFA